MVLARIVIDNDRFYKTASGALNKNISPMLGDSVEKALQYIEANAEDSTEAGVFTGSMYRKIRTSTYKGSRQGKLAGKFIKPQDVKLFISKPSKKDEEILHRLQFGLDQEYIWNNTSDIATWIQTKGIDWVRPSSGSRPEKIINYPNSIVVGRTRNSAYKGGGKNPIENAKKQIMQDIERKTGTKFRGAYIKDGTR